MSLWAAAVRFVWRYKVYGRQDLPDQSLVGSGDVTWRIEGEGTLVEPDVPSRNGEVDDISVLYIAPDTAGRHTITASVHDCLGRRAGESDEAVEARCNAEFSIRVLRGVRPASAPTPVPVNPAGPIPVVIPGGDGTQHSVFTPEEGGEAESADGSCTLRVPVGAVPNGEYIGVAISTLDAEMSDHRFAARGRFCEVSVVDSSGDAVESYLLEDAGGGLHPGSSGVPKPDRRRRDGGGRGWWSRVACSGARSGSWEPPVKSCFAAS